MAGQHSASGLPGGDDQLRLILRYLLLIIVVLCLTLAYVATVTPTIFGMIGTAAVGAAYRAWKAR